MLVIDCSVTMAWIFSDEKTIYTEKMLDLLNEEKCIVPSIWMLDVMNVLLSGEKRKRITSSQSHHFLNFLNSLPIHIKESQGLFQNESLLHLARTYGLSSYDAAYLDLAAREGVYLATLDNQLIEAAKKIGVKIVS